MNRNFIMEKSTIKKFLKDYQLNLLQFNPVSAGVENESAFVDTNNGRFVLRVYNKSKSRKEINLELAFMDFLSNTMPIPRILRNSKGLLLSTKNINGITRNFIIMGRIEGSHLYSSQLNLISEISKYQALMHKAAIKFKRNYKKPADTIIQDIIFFRNELKNAKKILSKDPVGTNCLILAKALIKEMEVNLDELMSLPAGLVHRDYDSDNIIVKDKVTGIIDFDDLSHRPFVSDLAGSLWWWLYGNRGRASEIFKKYVAGYEKYRKLTIKEKAWMPLFMRARNIAIGILLNANRKRKLDYLELKNALAFDKLVANLQGA